MVREWQVGLDNGIKVRFTSVHFTFFATHRDTKDHDWEVNEARWVPIETQRASLYPTTSGA
jgi:hypothetical protein